jgi:predicted metalloprotease with PDZ domain
MPTSTVNQITGPLQIRKIERVRSGVSSLAAWNNRKEGFRLAMRSGVAGCALLVFATLSSANAQTLKVRISIISVAPARIRIETELPSPTNVLSFRNTYAGVVGLGERIETVEAFDGSGQRVRVRKLAPGEFQSEENFSHVNYEVDVAEPFRPAQMSHVSWLNRDRGALMLGDLLPHLAWGPGGVPSALISVHIPTDWKVASNIQNEGSQFSTGDPETAVFLVGPSVHEKRHRLGSRDFSIISSGKFPFSDSEAIKIAQKIIEEYSRVTRFKLTNNAVLMLIPYPGEAGPESWSAETRGNDVVLVLGAKASRKKVLARLGIVLSHELLHLWVPNSLKLAGDYDWFFEGFTLYQALRTDLRLGLISFADYLETLALVYDSYLSAADGDRLSLIEASERRWTTSSSLVYEKGMLVAFIYDLALRSEKNCDNSLDGVYADLFQPAATGQRSANDTIIKVLNDRLGSNSFAKDYIESAGKISLAASLLRYGIQVQPEFPGTGPTKLVVSRDLDPAQRRLLGCIGYRR